MGRTLNTHRKASKICKKSLIAIAELLHTEFLNENQIIYYLKRGDKMVEYLNICGIAFIC